MGAVASGQDSRTQRSGASRQIIGLDLIRAAAALLVLCFHLGFWIWQDPRAKFALPLAYQPFTPLFSKGWVGVEIFFVISGFVIAYSAEAVTATRFLQHRLNRLFPAALVCSTFTGLLLVTAYPLAAVSADWLRSIVFWPVGPWIDGSYWTLPIEVAFYAFVWINLVAGKGRYLALSTGVLGILSAAICLLVLSRPSWVPHGTAQFLDAAGFPPSACLLLIHGTFFATGVFLFLILLRGFTPFRAVVLALSTAGCLAELIWHDHGMAAVTSTARHSVVPVSLWLGSVLALVAAVRWNEVVQRIVGKRGAWWTRQIGIATYPLYLLHAKIGQVGIGGLHRHVGYGPALVLATAAVTLLAAIVSQVLEPPIRTLMQRRLWGDSRTS